MKLLCVFLIISLIFNSILIYALSVGKTDDYKEALNKKIKEADKQ